MLLVDVAVPIIFSFISIEVEITGVMLETTCILSVISMAVVILSVVVDTPSRLEFRLMLVARLELTFPTIDMFCEISIWVLNMLFMFPCANIEESRVIVDDKSADMVDVAVCAWNNSMLVYSWFDIDPEASTLLDNEIFVDIFDVDVADADMIVSNPIDVVIAADILEVPIMSFFNSIDVDNADVCVAVEDTGIDILISVKGVPCMVV